MKFRPLLFLFIIIAFLATGCTNIQSPEFKKIDDFRVMNVGLQEANVGFKVTYYNPNDFTVTVKEAGVDVYIDTIFLGRFRQDTDIPVGKNMDFSIPLSGAVPFRKLMQLLPEKANGDVLVKAQGDVKVGKAGVFISRPIQYEGKHNLGDIRL